MERPSFLGWICLASLISLFSTATALELPQKVLAALGDGEYRVRENAQIELLKWARLRPTPSMEEVLRQSQISNDPEVRLRCQAVLRELVMDQYKNEGQGFVGIGRENKIVEIPGRTGPCHAVRVTSVRRGTPADRAGIRLNDLIISLNGEAWSEGTASEVFAERIAAMRPGTQVTLKIYRDGKLIDVDVVLVRRPLNANNPFFDGQNFDPEAGERAAMEAYFRDWLSERKLRK
ncbi:MAG: PDZ domain-containing protein [Verrucomicrobiota bacterium]